MPDYSVYVAVVYGLAFLVYAGMAWQSARRAKMLASLLAEQEKSPAEAFPPQ
ncbi:MAG: hypothetical protein HQL77_12615 [Magnetococcales bacterium]|nr:hypothetical protein [Magnetococcales bacterium]